MASERIDALAEIGGQPAAIGGPAIGAHLLPHLAAIDHVLEQIQLAHFAADLGLGIGATHGGLGGEIELAVIEPGYLDDSLTQRIQAGNAGLHGTHLAAQGFQGGVHAFAGLLKPFDIGLERLALRLDLGQTLLITLLERRHVAGHKEELGGQVSKGHEESHPGYNGPHKGLTAKADLQGPPRGTPTQH
ncbi:MAG: hypothetical protein ABEJ96_09325 [Thiohalorhabdaceae bacterium]